jgi:endonuclease YncB( thermonuclease family)
MRRSASLASLGFAAAFLALATGALGLAATAAPGPADPGPLASPEAVVARFPLCGSRPGPTCVTDGDTFRLDGARIRIADIDTPETHSPKCPAEKALGERATRRLAALLEAGPFTLSSADRDRDRDRYGRLLRVVVRDGQSLGAVLVREGLARPWDGARHPWCA